MTQDVTIPPTTMAAVSVPLTDQVRLYIAAALRPNTRRAYAAQLRQWIDYCERAGVAPFPSDPNAVAIYLTERANVGQSVSTLRTVVAAIKGGNDAKGVFFDTKNPVLIKTLRGIRNGLAGQRRFPRQADPIRGGDVLKLMDTAHATMIGARDSALFALGYVFALRESELVGLDLETLGSGSAVLRITAMTMEVQFAQSKTDTEGEMPTVVVPRVENAEALKAVERWIKLASIKKGEPLMRRVRKGDQIGAERLHPLSVARIIKSRAVTFYESLGASEDQAMIAANKFSGHSLRVGFCVTAAEGGADLRAIATVTRHRSLTMPMRYAQKAAQLRTAPHLIAGVGLSRR